MASLLATRCGIIVGLAIGGVAAAPLGTWLVKRVRPRPMLLFVGILAVALSVRTGLKRFGAI